MVSLTDTTGDADVHITDELIDSGLAELDITNTDMVTNMSVMTIAIVTQNNCRWSP